MPRPLPAIALALAVMAVETASPARAGDHDAGRSKAEAMCQTCHGVDGVATIPTAPNLSGQQELYLIGQLEAYRSGKRTHEQMSIIASSLSDDDIKDLAAWYAGIEIVVVPPE